MIISRSPQGPINFELLYSARDNSPFNYYIEKDGNEYVLCKTNNIDRLRADQSDFIDKSTIKFQDDDLTLYYYGH